MKISPEASKIIETAQFNPHDDEAIRAAIDCDTKFVVEALSVFGMSNKLNLGDVQFRSRPRG
jgi:hypothetical protein